ncbi:DUF3955 domain-containing protein [Paenibacillus sp. 1001270B_150601_E10]|uniref:DUF3955 domain-containing protein n=1 Tax=Paenibacillus sp. 1001270B_150601_E10 TaxID=2787079 RepID=UPI00189C96F9|nr:DUF3955 domain-containing protein [Paenibacillus sp. 1001270B_150601_E10]
MKKQYLFASLPIVLGLLCFVIFSMIGSYVASDGTLVEPFFLVPIGYLFLFLGALTLMFTVIRSVIKKNHRHA